MKPFKELNARQKSQIIFPSVLLYRVACYIDDYPIEQMHGDTKPYVKNWKQSFLNAARKSMQHLSPIDADARFNQARRMANVIAMDVFKGNTVNNMMVSAVHLINKLIDLDQIDLASDELFVKGLDQMVAMIEDDIGGGITAMERSTMKNAQKAYDKLRDYGWYSPHKDNEK
jgi:hypothetical protein